MKKLPFLVLLPLLAVLLCGCGTPKNVEVGVKAPLNVKKGQDFVIVATVRNTAGKVQTLESLDVGDGYLKGVAITGTEPDHQEATHIPIDNTMSYVFKLPLNPGEEKKVLLRARGVQAGDYNSEIDFCINSGVSFLSKGIRTVVE